MDSKIAQDILELLPSGSGIDASWNLENIGDNLVFSNSFHVMDNGSYTHWVDFEITLSTQGFIWDLLLFGEEEEEADSLGDYLTDTIALQIDEFLGSLAYE